MRGGEKELRDAIKAWNNTHTESWLKQNISWHFNPPTASHFGRIYKREIRTIRKIIASTLTEQPMRLTDKSLVTVLCEIEAILNNRPLSEVTDDPSDFEALTPNHILLFNAGVTFPPGVFRKEDMYIKRRYKQVQYLIDLFWAR